MSRDIFTIPELMEQIEVLEVEDEDLYSDIPGFEGRIEQWTDKAILVKRNWFPISQLRKSEDNDAIYASLWILEQKGF
jgi:hypothetical protein